MSSTLPLWDSIMQLNAIRGFQRLIAPVALAAVAVGSAHASILPSDVVLTFLQPDGVVAGDAVIPVWLRLTNTSSTEAFVLDPSMSATLGLGSGFLPSMGWDGSSRQPFASYTSTHVSTWMTCSGNFLNDCEDAAYTFDWSGGNPFVGSFTLAAGDRLDYLWGNFVPVGGLAPEGTYTLYGASIGVRSNGVAANGSQLTGVMFVTHTCTGDSAAACEGQSVFTRTVTAVPEPATWALMLGGATGLLLLASRRQTPNVFGALHGLNCAA